MTPVARIIARMEELRWKQKNLAEKTGIHSSSLSKLFADKERKPHARTAKIIADALGVTDEWIMSGSEPKFPGLTVQEPEPVHAHAEISLANLRAVVMTYMEYIEERGYKVPPDLIADGACKLYARSVAEGSVKSEDLKRYILGERQASLFA